MAKFPVFYENILQKILAGFLKEASNDLLQLESFSRLTDPERMLFSLLKLRIAYLSSATSALEFLPSSKALLPHYVAEGYFVHGLNYFHLGKYLEGHRYFKNASSLYGKQEFWDKKLLSDFNILIAEVNIDLHYSPSLQLMHLNQLLSESIKLKNQHVQGLIFRQRSMVFKDLGKMNAALEDALKSYDLSLASNSFSDIQICLINLADISLELNLIPKAQAYFEMIPSPIEKRNIFPYRYIQKRLKGENEISLEGVSYLCPHFKNRACINNCTFKGLSFLETLTTKERVLYQCLLESSATREQLATILWPDEVLTKSHYNRLYQLISRLNKKITSSIEKRNHSYYLKKTTTKESISEAFFLTSASL